MEGTWREAQVPRLRAWRKEGDMWLFGKEATAEGPACMAHILGPVPAPRTEL